MTLCPSTLLDVLSDVSCLDVITLLYLYSFTFLEGKSDFQALTILMTLHDTISDSLRLNARYDSIFLYTP